MTASAAPQPAEGVCPRPSPGPVRLRVGGVTPLTTIDFPGRLAAVVYCQGCPWRCAYCHNGHLVGAAGGEDIPWPVVARFLQRRRGLLDGVVFSGGEPTAQVSLEPAVEEVRTLGYRVALHTGGPYPGRLARVLPLVDWVGLDIKAPPGVYPRVTGVAGSGAAAWESLEAVLASGVDHEVRTTVHPDLLSQAELETLAGELAARGAERWVLQPVSGGPQLDPALAAPTARQALATLDLEVLQGLLPGLRVRGGD